MSIICLIATTANLAGTYNNGSSNFPGQGATFTFTATGAQFIDGHQLVLSVTNYYLIKDQSDPTQNGIYYVSTAGDVGVNCVLTRTPGFDFPQGLNTAGSVPVVGGGVNYQTIWSLSLLVNTIGTDNVNYLQVGSANAIQAITNVTTASYVSSDTDRVLVCNRAGAISITLPGPVATGFTLTVKDTSGAASSNHITIAAGVINIDGASTYVINTNYGFVTLIFNGTQWNVIT